MVESLANMACLDCLRELDDRIKTTFHGPDSLLVLQIFDVLWAGGKKISTIEADTSEYLPDVIKHVAVVNWFDECNMAKMTGTLYL